MKKPVLYLLLPVSVLFLSILPQSSHAQIIYGATGSNGMGGPSELWDINVQGCSCEINLIGPLETSSGMDVRPEGDIALCPDGTMFVSSFGELFIVDPTSGLCTSVPGIPILELSHYLDGLACAGNGILYGAPDEQNNFDLVKYDLNAGTLIIVGQMPYYASGGMFFSNGSLYMFAHEGLVLVDTINPENSVLLFDLPLGIGIDGSTVYNDCNMLLVYVQDYITSEHYLAFYSLLDGTIQPLCVDDFGWMFLTSPSEFIPVPCTVEIDLDCNDSSGATESDFNSPEFSCLTPNGVPIADIDVLLFSGDPIQEMTAILNPNGNLPDDPDEVLDFAGSASNINVIGEGSTSITLINDNGMASIQDFIDALHAIVYINLATDPTPGSRIVEVQFTLSNGEMSNIATAYLEVNALPLIPVDLGDDVEVCEGETVTFDAGISNANYLWSNNQTTQTITVSQAGQYSVTVMDGINCPNQDTVEFSTIPVISISLTGDEEMCDNETATLTVLNDSPFPIDIEISVDPGQDISISDMVGNYSFTVSPVVETVYAITLVTPSQQACINYGDLIQIVRVHPIYQVDIDETICEGDSIYIEDSWETQEGVYDVHLNTIEGCDSLVTIILEVLPSEKIYLQSSTCDSSQIGVFFEYLNNPSGCDTVIQTTITLLPSNTTQLTFISCRSADTGVTYDTLVNSLGCDSFLVSTTNYLAPADTTFLTAFTCDSFQTGTFFDTLTGGDGCDSLVALIVSLAPTDTTILQSTSCIPAEIGVFETLLSDAMGCDSLVIDVVSAGIPDTNYIFLTSCDSSSLGVTEELFTSSSGCDSLVITTITYSEKDSSFILVHTCNPLDSGTVVTTFTNQFGCDSIVTTQTNLQPSHGIQLFSSSCNPVDTGIFIQTLINQFGCDSIITETVTFLESHAVTIQSNSCHVADTGTFILNLINQLGCDSIVTEIVSLVEIDTVILSDLTCDANQTDTAATMYTTADGCDSLVIEMISLFPLPVLNIISNSDFNGFDISCAGANDGSVSVIVNGVGPLGYLWNTNSTNQNLNDVGGGDYQVTVTDGNGCDISSSITLTEPEPFLISFMISPPECFIESTGSIGINPSGGVAPYTYSINGGSPQSSPTFSGLEGGLYQLTAFDANQCEASELIWIKEPLRVEVDLGSDQMTFPGDTILLQAIVNIPFDSINLINWIGIDSIPCANCLTQTIVPVLTTSYAIEVVSVDGCSDQDEMTVFIDEANEIYVPNIFSPNDDGINDRLLISAGRGIKEITSFHVFDRWGNLVFESIQFQPGDPVYAWDGRMDNQSMNQGVFTYKLLALLRDGQTEVRYGDITLIR